MRKRIREGVPRDLLLEARYGSSFDLEVASVQIRYAEHSPGSCGFLLKTKYGNIYHPGDGKFDHPHKEEIGSLDVDYLLLPINDTNLGVGFAALLTQILQPRVVIPCHFGFVNPPIRSQGGHPAEYLTAIRRPQLQDSPHGHRRVELRRQVCPGVVTRDPAGEHRFSCPRCPDHQDVVSGPGSRWSDSPRRKPSGQHVQAHYLSRQVRLGWGLVADFLDCPWFRRALPGNHALCL